MRTLNQLVDEIVNTDVLVIGSGATGMRAAIDAAKKGVTVTLANKGYFGKSGSTLVADADIAIDSASAVNLFNLPGSAEDNPELFFEDIIIEGEYLNNQRLVEIHTSEAPYRLKQLVEWGAKIKKLMKSPGHRYPRGVWILGSEINRVLKKELKKNKNINIFEHLMILDLVIEEENKQLLGAIGLSLGKGEFCFFKTKAVILCAGGAMRLYSSTTAPEELTGDGLAMAYRAGVELVDMEFPMFLPYTMISPQALKGSIFPYDLSAYFEAEALNVKGERYMKKWDPERLEKSTRDINSVAAAIEILEGRGTPRGGTYLLLKGVKDDLISYSKECLPDIQFNNWKYGGFNLKKFLPNLTEEALETAPACHFWNGGIKINGKCETNIRGLYAAGEVTGGIHGANRISGNAMIETQVWGARSGKYAALFARANKYTPKILNRRVEELVKKYLCPLEKKEGLNPIEVRKKIRKIAGDKVGIVRKGKLLREAIEEIDRLKKEVQNQTLSFKVRTYNKEWIESLQNLNLIQVLEMTTRTSLWRTESRGALYRTDFPKTNNKEWLKNILIKNIKNKMSLNTKDVIITTLIPPKTIREYGRKR